LDSYWRVLHFARYARDYDGASLVTQKAYVFRGRLFVGAESWERGGPRKSDFNISYSPIHKDDYAPIAAQSNWIGFGCTSETNSAFEYRIVSAPWWLLVAASAIPALTAAKQRCRASRFASAGRCISCGYDLTANVSGACPECGRCKET
jgi:hypothetical protein